MIESGLARATVSVDLTAVAANVERLRSLVDPAEVWAVVKADAYGHWAQSVGRAALAAGATRLCVATWDEARSLREELPNAPILIMSPLVPGQEGQVEDVEVAVSSVEGYARLRSLARVPLGVHVKVDTGMGRWGMRPEDALRIGRSLAEPGMLRLAGLMSHLASSDSDPAFTERQIVQFREIAGQFPPCPRHIANSAAALRIEDSRFDAVRCGLAIFGLSPFAGEDPAADGLRPALRFESYVADVKLLQPGESAGYGRRFVATEPTWIGLVPAGYADGVPRILSGQAEVLVGGVRRRIAATVSMDQLSFVIGPTCDVEPGDPVTLIGRDGADEITAGDWAELAGTISYEIVTGLAPRLRRVEHVFHESR